MAQQNVGYVSFQGKEGLQYKPHRENWGLCAPGSVAGDQRALIRTPYTTFLFITTYAAGGFATTTSSFVGARQLGAPGQITCCSAGLGDAGGNVGITDNLTLHETSLFSEGFPFRDYDFLLRAIAIVPEGKPFRSSTVLDANQAVSMAVNGNAVPIIAEPLSGQIVDAMVSNFFMTHSVKLGFRSESAQWDIGVPLLLPGGFGLVGSDTPTNADAINGKVIPLPFPVQIPRYTRNGTGAQIIITREVSQHFNIPIAQVVSNGVAFMIAAGGAAADPPHLCMMFKVLLVGERLCVPQSPADEAVYKLAQKLGVSVDQAAQAMAEIKK